MQEKVILRKKYLDKRKKLTKNFVEEKSLIVQNKFLETDIYRNYQNICVYMDFNNEVKTEIIIKKAIEDGKNVYVPKIENENLNFIKIEKNSKFIKNKYNIKEPIDNTKKFQKDYFPSVFLVPGVVFSKEKYRIGYGGGYYDKWIALNPNNIYIGLCYDFQIIDKFERESFDKKLNYIITEENII